jgi:PD-(D/E)XK nuclease superfamily protein
VLSQSANRNGLLRQFYSPDEIDAYAAYCADIGKCYLLPIGEFAHRIAIQLRLKPPKNNHNLRINWAREYEFAAKLSDLGAIAQLGERVSGRDEVAGSSPAGSTRQIHLLT